MKKTIILAASLGEEFDLKANNEINNHYGP
jgi:hypothetical protein